MTDDCCNGPQDMGCTHDRHVVEPSAVVRRESCNHTVESDRNPVGDGDRNVLCAPEYRNRSTFVVLGGGKTRLEVEDKGVPEEVKGTEVQVK